MSREQVLADFSMSVNTRKWALCEMGFWGSFAIVIAVTPPAPLRPLICCASFSLSPPSPTLLVRLLQPFPGNPTLAG